MKRIYNVFLYCISMYIFFNASLLYSKFSFKEITSEVTSWVKGVFNGANEETYYKELPFPPDGTVVVTNYEGSVGVKSWSLGKVAIEAIKKAPAKDLSSMNIETTLAGNQLSVKTVNAKKNGSVEYQLIVPVHTNVIVQGNNCPIKTKNVNGIHQLSTQGSIDIQGACNTIQASTTSSINVALTSIPQQASISLKSSKSTISLTLPQTTHATIHAKTLYSSIISKHFITLKPITVMLNKQTYDQFKKTIDGTIGSGKATIDISAYNGITIQ